MSLTGRTATQRGPEGPPSAPTFLRILIQGMNFPPELIGVGKYSGELAAWLAERGHHVEVVTAHPHYPGFAARTAHPGRYRRTREGGIVVTRCPLLLRCGGRGIWRLLAPLSFGLTAAPALVWRALRFRPDLVLCVEPTLFAAPAALLAAWLVGARTVLHVQDLEIDAAFAACHLKGALIRRVGLAAERALLSAFSAVITIAEGMAANLRQKGLDAGKVSILRNWMTVPPAGTSIVSPAHLRAELGIEASERVVVYAGHLGAKQAIPGLLDALTRLSERCAVRIVIAGEGPMADAVAAVRSRLPNLVVLPLQDQPRHAALLAMADVHVLPQDRSAADLVFPSKLGPMLATGRPVVVTAALGTELHTWLSGAAVLVPPCDPAALASALHAALHGAVHDTLSARARTLASTLDAATVLPAFESTLIRLARRERSHLPSDLEWSVGDVEAVELP